MNVNDNIGIYLKNLKLIDVKFNIIKRDFGCENNKLKSLEENTDKSVGDPKIVKGSFSYIYNKLRSL